MASSAQDGGCGGGADERISGSCVGTGTCARLAVGVPPECLALAVFVRPRECEKLLEESDRATKELHEQLCQQGRHAQAFHNQPVLGPQAVPQRHRMFTENAEKQRHIVELSQGAADLRRQAGAVAQKAFALPDGDERIQRVVLAHLGLIAEVAENATIGQRVEALIERASVQLADRERDARETLPLLRRTLALIDSTLASDVANESGGGDERLIVNARVNAQRRAAQWAPWRADTLRSIAFAECQTLARSVGGGFGGSLAAAAPGEEGGLGAAEEARLEQSVDELLREASAEMAFAMETASGLARVEAVVAQRYADAIIGTDFRSPRWDAVLAEQIALSESQR